MDLRVIDVVILLLLVGLYFMSFQDPQDRTHKVSSRYQLFYVADKGKDLRLLDQQSGPVYYRQAGYGNWGQAVSPVKLPTPSEKLKPK
jgi:hypothetical protein